MSGQTIQPGSNVTNVDDFVSELNAGVLIDQLGISLSAAALATIANGRSAKGKVSLDFTFGQIGDNDQVLVSVKLSSVMPSKKGKKSEENTTETPFFVGKGGQLTIDAPKESLTGQFSLQQENELPSKVRHIK